MFLKHLIFNEMEVKKHFAVSLVFFKVFFRYCTCTVCTCTNTRLNFADNIFIKYDYVRRPPGLYKHVGVLIVHLQPTLRFKSEQLLSVREFSTKIRLLDHSEMR